MTVVAAVCASVAPLVLSVDDRAARVSATTEDLEDFDDRLSGSNESSPPGLSNSSWFKRMGGAGDLGIVKPSCGCPGAPGTLIVLEFDVNLEWCSSAGLCDVAVAELPMSPEPVAFVHEAHLPCPHDKRSERLIGQDYTTSVHTGCAFECKMLPFWRCYPSGVAARSLEYGNISTTPQHISRAHRTTTVL